jgi:hypothetical protein
MGKDLGRMPLAETVVGRAARYHNEGISNEMIAERMNIKVNTVHGYLSRARYRGLADGTPPPDPRGGRSRVNKAAIEVVYDRIMAGAPGENVVYYEGVAGWHRVPSAIRALITSLVKDGSIVTLTRRDGQGTFSMIAQRTKRGAGK